MTSARPIPLFQRTTIEDKRTFRILVVGLLILATWLRFQALFSAGLHADEALFASWARAIGTWRDPLLQFQAVDKPPLFFYLQAVFFPLLGTAEPWVPRLVNVIASLLLVPLILRLVITIYRDYLAALLAGALVVFSPLAGRYSSTVFLDPLLTILLVASLLATAEVNSARSSRKPLVAGLLFGMATATKYQAWLMLPLLLAVGLVRRRPREKWRSWLIGLIVPLALLAAWTLARGGESLWARQMTGFGGLRLARSWELWPRLEAWGIAWGELIGSQVLAFLALLALPIFFAVLISELNWPTVYDQLFVIFVASYAIMHWFIAVPVWDRYLLPVLPLVALIFGRFVSRLLAFLAPGVPVPLRQMQLVAALVAVFLLIVPAVTAAGAHRTRDSGDGVEAVASQLVDEPYGTVLYDHWYSWHWAYYLFDSGVYFSWYPHPASLVEDLEVFADDDAQRYVVLPHDGRALPVHRALAEAGFVLEAQYEADGIVLYRVRKDGR